MPAFRFAGENELIDAAAFEVFNPKSPTYGQCRQIVNADVDNKQHMHRRNGSTLVTNDVLTSAKGMADGAYGITGNRICRFNGAVTTILDPLLAINDLCEFEQVNNVVVFSDGSVLGVVNGSAVTRMDNAADWVNIENLEQWIADHYPADPAKWDGVNSNSNMDVDMFKVASKAGTCLHFFNGALYMALGKWVYCTKTFDIAHMDLRFCVVAGFPDNVTAISHVEDGLFVGTTGGTYFLPGTGIVVKDNVRVKGFTQRDLVNNFPVIKGTMLRVPAELVPAVKAQGHVVMWSSPKGIFVGVAGGSATNLSDQQVDLPAVSSGSAFLRDIPGMSQYVVSLGSEVRTVNTATGAHSRYYDYEFTNLFAYAGVYYGAHTTGVYNLIGSRDGHRGGVVINAYARTAVSSLGDDRITRLAEIYIHGRCDGEMAIDYIVDEQLAVEDDLAPFYIQQLSNCYVEPPRGLEGNSWQFVIKNVSGSDFTLQRMEVNPVTLAARIMTR